MDTSVVLLWVGQAVMVRVTGPKGTTEACHHPHPFAPSSVMSIFFAFHLHCIYLHTILFSPNFITWYFLRMCLHAISWIFVALWLWKAAKAWFTLCVQTLPEVRPLLNVLISLVPEPSPLFLLMAKDVFWRRPMVVEFNHPVHCSACRGEQCSEAVLLGSWQCSQP